MYNTQKILVMTLTQQNYIQSQCFFISYVCKMNLNIKSLVKYIKKPNAGLTLNYALFASPPFLAYRYNLPCLANSEPRVPEARVHSHWMLKEKLHVKPTNRKKKNHFPVLCIKNTFLFCDRNVWTWIWMFWTPILRWQHISNLLCNPTSN